MRCRARFTHGIRQVYHHRNAILSISSFSEGQEMRVRYFWQLAYTITPIIHHRATSGNDPFVFTTKYQVGKRKMTRGKLHRLVALKFARKKEKEKQQSAKYHECMHPKWPILPDNYWEKRAPCDMRINSTTVPAWSTSGSILNIGKLANFFNLTCKLAALLYYLLQDDRALYIYAFVW